MATETEDRGRDLDRICKVQRWCIKSEAAPRINAALDLARSEPGIPVLPEELDRDAWLFNCPNGTLELKTGTLREHRREDLITKLCPTEYLPDATCPQWERFLNAVFRQERSLITFVKRLLGRCLTGDVREQILPIFWGKGANGKSTLINIVLGVMGAEYAMKAHAEMLIQSRGEQHPTGLASLFGMRLVVTSETQQGRQLNESLVKDLTGGEPIRARRCKEDFWEFAPTFKLFMLTNHKPVVRGTDEGIRRRLRLVPFVETFWDPDDPNKAGQRLPAELRQDKQLPEKLRTEAPGILAWLVQGCLDWQRDGLTLPDAVKVATREYLDAEDLIANWLLECCIIGGESFKARASALYESFRDWCERGGEKPVSQRVFGEAMTERNFKRTISNGTWYSGVMLQPKESESVL